MILESIRIMTDALAHEEYGVNAQIDTITLDVTDRPPPHIQLIGDITRDNWAAELTDPVNVPALLVAPAGPAAIDGEVLAGVIREGETVPIDVIYIGRDANAEDAFAHMFMSFRAVLRTLKMLMDNDQAEDRIRNGICIIEAKDVTWGLAEMPLGSTGATGALTVTFTVRDTVV